MLVKKDAWRMNDLQIFKDLHKFLDFSNMKSAYPIRPLKMMHCYPYTPVSATNLNMFYAILEDPIGAELQAEVLKALESYKNYYEANGLEPIPMSVFCEMLPVVVKTEHGDGLRFYRGEVNAVRDVEHKVNVHLIDLGRDVWFDSINIFQPSVALIRLPKLVLECSISQIVPNGNAKTWSPKVDYGEILKGDGKIPPTIQPAANANGVWAVYATADGIDVGLKAMMIHQVADVVALKKLPASNDRILAFPKFDFSDWLGLKTPMFAIRPLKAPELILQLDTVKANELVEKIASYIETTPSAFSIPFEKKEGTACLCRYGGPDAEVFRGEICRVIDVGNNKKVYGIKYVDYAEYGVAREDAVAYIPEELRTVPECAAKVLIADLLTCVPEDSLNDQQKAVFKASLKEKDVFSTIVSVGYEWEGKSNGIVVTLHIPQNENDFVGTKLSELLKIPDLPLSNPYAYFGPALTMNFASQIFSLSSRYYPGVTYSGVLSCGSSFSSIFLQMEDDADRSVRLTSEMTEFYYGCDDEEMESIQRSVGDLATPGLFVAVEQEIDGEKGWYRARVLQKVETGEQNVTGVEVIYVDFGDVDRVEITSVRPLIPYFAKDPVLALQAAVPVSGILQANEDIQSAAVLEYCDYGACALQIELGQDGLNTNYAWVKKADGTELAEWLVGKGMAKHVIRKSQ